MKHFRNILLLASFLGFALVAFGSEISSETAEDTVKGWLRLDRAPLGEPLGNQITNVETFRDNASNILYHVVYLMPSGFVIVSGDDLVEPIIAFASRGRFDPSLNNPLGALVNRDVPNRVARARALRTTAITGHFLNARNKWQKLKQDFLQQGPQGPVPADFNGISTISDIRVAPFLQTLWNQQTANNGLACYNYYTPPYAVGTSSNYPCGCVATALAQTLYYFQYPTVGVGALSFSITVDGTSRAASLRGGDGLGGPYIWGNMPVNPNNPTANQCQAIGALTFDAGVAIGMDYEAGGSAASVQNAGNALVNTFGYSNAKYFYGYDLTNVVNPNLDAHLPVIFAIYVGNVFGVGHCVVCDGYGYNYGTLYHHINMGWGGYDNAWFALPDINASYDFNDLAGCLYNIYTNGSGEIISGHIVDQASMAVANAIISAVPSSGGTFTTTSDNNGIYALVKIPSATQYTLTVSKAGYPSMVASYSTGTSGGWPNTYGNVGGADFKLTYFQISPQSGFNATGPVGGPFNVNSQSYSLTNYGLTALNWTLSNTSVWLNVSSSSGTLASGGPASNITVSINDMAKNLPGGTYSAQICFTNMNDGVVISRQFTLQVVPDTQNPAINILYPTPGLVLSNIMVQVNGTASDNVAVASVWCQINGGPWTIAAGTNNWTATMNVAAGNNTIQAYALDTSGNSSATNNVSFVAVLSTVLTVSANGLGSLNPNYNNAILQIGKNYSITATAGTGFVFTNWTGGITLPLAVLTNGTTLQFVMQSNLVLRANFVDTIKPTLSITNLVSGQRWSNVVFTVRGTAGDNWLVSNVWYQLNGMTWSNALTVNLWTNWSQALNLVPGTNTVAAFAMDLGGNVSTTNSVSFDYVVTNQLGVSANGLGTISPNYSNAWLEIGRNYSMTATPGSGFVVTNWTISTNWLGGRITNNATVQFMMASNLTLQINFADVTKPTLTVTAPTAGQHMTNALAKLVGTASDNWNVAGVWYQLNSNAWNLATTANNFANWTNTVTLITGTNTLKFYALDLGGNYSATNSFSIVSSNTFKLQLAFTNAMPLKTNGLVFSLQLSTGLNGQIQVSTNLTSWATLTNFVGTNSMLIFRDPAATNSSRRFYRAVIP